MTMIAEGLSSDFEVNVLCAQPNYSRRGVIAPRFEVHNNVRIRRLPGTRLDKNVIPFRVINMLTFGIPVFLSALLRLKAGDRALVVTTPPNLPYAVAAAALVRGSTYTLLIHDSYPSVLVAAGKASPKSILVKSWRWCNRWLFKYASKIIVLGRDMKQLAEKESEGLDVPIVYIPNWAELELVGPSPRSENRLLQELGLTNKFVFLYAGNMGFSNDLETLVECASQLREDQDIHFIFLGSGVKTSYLKEEIKTRKLRNITLLGPRPRSEQPDFLNACDVAIVSQVKGTFGTCVPSRIYNILAAGKPLLAITEPLSEIHTVINEEHIGWCVSPGDENKLVTTIRYIVSQRERLEDMGEKARAVAEEKYNPNDIIACYRSQMIGS
jgi:colanic acid biosynthesis glycosyl transferase WcaI